jgi:hypothetical protein
MLLGKPRSRLNLVAKLPKIVALGTRGFRMIAASITVMHETPSTLVPI